MKKFNKILSLLMAFAMVLSMLPASAFAVVNEHTTGSNDKYIDGVPAGDRDLMQSLRDNYPEKGTGDDLVISESSDMIVTEDKNPSVSLDKGINAADKLVDEYKRDEIVRVIVVLESQSLLERGFTTEQIAANGAAVESLVSTMRQEQNALMADINALAQSLMPETYRSIITAKYNYSIVMNGVAVDVPYGIVKDIAKLDNVVTAYVAPQFDLPEDMTKGVATPSMVTTQTLAGSALAWEAGFTGAGMRIAVIDTGLDTDHPSFIGGVPVTDTSLTLAEVNSVLTQLNAYKLYPGLTANALYISTKIPYHFCYVDNDLDVTHDYDTSGDHGTHVAGIAAANKIDSTNVVGVAPEAQLIIMKVFGNNGGAYWDDIIAAIEDCFLLNVDAINMSLGSPSGFTWESDDTSMHFVQVMQTIKNTDIIASVSAGNSYSAGCDNYWYDFLIENGVASYFTELIPGRNQTMDPANGVVSSPATFIGSTVVASLENNTTAAEVLVANDGKGGEDYVFTFGDNYTYFTYYLGGNGDFKEHEYDYVVIPGLGAESDYEGIDVEGKIALVERGELAFTDKQLIAAAAGAVGIIVYDNGDSGEIFYMQDAKKIPNITVIRADGLKLIELAGEDGIGTLVVRYNNVIIADNASAGTMSDFSSWGVTPDLRLVPDITSYGGNIYSTYTDGEYGIMSGTSMSAPHIAGMSALLLQYLRGTDYAVLKTDADYHLVAEALLMSTADPVVEPSGVFYSPRKQGAGNANIYNAIKSPVFLTVNGDKPSVSFGDDDERKGVYTFSFEFNNLTGVAQSYTLDATVLTDQFSEKFYQATGGQIKLMGETSRELTSTVEFSAENVTVPANGVATVTVTITLSDADKAYMDANYPNGIFVDGFVQAFATAKDGIDLVVPFMGFYGDWSDARVFDTYSWYHEGMPLAERYASILWADATNGVIAGGNPYEATLTRFDPDFKGEITDPVLSPNGDGTNDYIDDMYLSLMRNAKLVEFIWRDETGKVLFQRDAEYARQSSYQSGYGQIVPFVYSWWFADSYDFTDANGKYLPNGSKVIMDIQFYLDDGDDVMDDKTSVTFTVDTVFPEIVDSKLNYDEKSNERKIQITVADDREIAAVALLTRMGSVVEMIKPTEKNAVKNADGSFTLEFDVTEMDDEFVLVVGDYGGNERYYNVEFKDGTDHVRANAFYGYRNLINYNAGNGYIYLLQDYNGWHSFAANNASTMMMHTSMFTEGETAVIAADYVDGYIIAIDAENQIFAMKAGNWTRMNLGEFELNYPYACGPVLDMTYDFKNNVMYVLTDEQYAGAGGVLATIDILTGEVTPVGKITMPEDHPGQLMTLACDNNGVLYAISYVAGAKAGDQYTGDLYTVDLENMVVSSSRWTASTIPVKYVGETGYIPDYRQSMTFDHDTNELYWVAYGSPYAADPATFFHVNKTTGKLTAISDVQYDSWMTAIFKPFTKSEDILPAVELEELNLNMVTISMSIGATRNLFATPVPYYAPMGELVWATSDKSVATVENGVVKAVGEGRAEITVTCGDVTASCIVDVLNLTEDLTFYEWGNESIWMTMNAQNPIAATTLEDAITPSSPYNGFMAAEYFNGWLYAYESGGAFYRIDPETMQGVRLGSCGTNIFSLAFNYADGFMYAVEEKLVDMWSPATYVLHRVDLNTGALEEVCEISAVMPMAGIAIDYSGVFYTIGYDTMTYSMSMVAFMVGEDYMTGGLGIQYMGIFNLPLWTINNYTSMAYSFKDKGFYVADSLGQLIWIDQASLFSNEPRVVTVGEIGHLASMYGYAMNMSMFVVPAFAPETPAVKVNTVTLPESYMLLEGGTTAVTARIEPWNAYPEITYTIADESVATVDANGMVTGVKEGVTTLTVKVEGVETALTTTITVLESTGYINGYLLDDLAGGGYVFARFSDTNPTSELQAFFGDDRFSVFAGAYFDGTIYAYGQDQYGDLGYYYYFLQIDPVTYEMTEIARVTHNLRDMAFDYTSGNLYAIAQGGELTGAVVQMDLETGAMTIIGDTGIRYVAMTIDAEGQMYAIGEDDYLYAIDKHTAKATKIGYTGVDAGALYQSMHYDLDTGNVYWAQIAGDQTSSLRLVDLKTGITCGIGTISPVGAMMTALFTVPENEPVVPGEEVKEAGIVITERATTKVGGTVKLDATILTEVELTPPEASANGIGSSAGMTIKWTSSDNSVATVDKDGVVTGVSAGVAIITAQVGKYTDTCVVTITEDNRLYYAYDKSNGQWISFDGETYDNLGNFAVNVERVDAEDEAKLQASYYVQELDLIYGVDANGDVVVINPNTFERTGMRVYDFNGDGVTTKADVQAFLNAVNFNSEYNFVYDLNTDGVLNTADVQIVLDALNTMGDETPAYITASLGTTYSLTKLEYDWEWDEYWEYEVECEMKAVDMAYDNGKLYVALIASNEDAWVEMAVIAEIDVVTGEINYIFESEEVRPGNIYVTNGRAFMVDTWFSGMINYVDLYSEEQIVVQDVLIKQYWGDCFAGSALFKDELTGIVYGIRDNTDTSGSYDEDWNYIPWDGVTGDSVLYTVCLSDGSIVRIGEIGNNIVVRGMFIR